MSKLLVKPTGADGRVIHVTPESAGWTYVGFDLWKLKPGAAASGSAADRETCLVFVGGKGRVTAGSEDLGVLGERTSPFEGRPAAGEVSRSTANRSSQSLSLSVKCLRAGHGLSTDGPGPNRR